MRGVGGAWRYDGIKDPGARFTELRAVTIVFRYPLTRKARLKSRSETGFTRAEIIECIRSGYRKIYAEEREESKWGIWDTRWAIF